MILIILHKKIMVNLLKKLNNNNLIIIFWPIILQLKIFLKKESLQVERYLLIR